MPEGSENINYIQTADNSLHCILCHTSQISDDFSVPFLSLIISIINNINMLICWFSAVRYTVKLRNHKYVNPCTRPSPSPPSSSPRSHHHQRRWQQSTIPCDTHGAGPCTPSHLGYPRQGAKPPCDPTGATHCGPPLHPSPSQCQLKP